MRFAGARLYELSWEAVSPAMATHRLEHELLSLRASEAPPPAANQALGPRSEVWLEVSEVSEGDSLNSLSIDLSGQSLGRSCAKVGDINCWVP